jgi:hypothetical protein
MRYLLLIYGDESARSGEMTPEAMEAENKRWTDYTEWLHQKGWHQAGEGLEPTADATTVREQNGKVMTTDGPFAETKEQLGGFYLIDCPNLDDAIEAASKMPNLPYGGSVEVRPIQEFG